jgi:hypothetical protein
LVRKPVDGMAGRRSWSHVQQEVVERPSPSTTDSDYRSAIILKSRGGLAVTAVENLPPYGVLQRIVRFGSFWLWHKYLHEVFNTIILLNIAEARGGVPFSKM